MAIAIHVFLHAGSYRVAGYPPTRGPTRTRDCSKPTVHGCIIIFRLQILFQVVYFMHLQLILSLSQTVGPRRVVLSPAETAGTRQVNSAPKEQIPKQYSTWLTRCHGRDGRPVDRPVPS
ncbi:hypothetical protein C8F04DRAFT_1179471 [Mycena alexandri]|uniref:Uncharacterized protein n=1 Tax=Mycena alexandri TaxID=1745969 RepID=A0AAD6XB48_9AGAR|nr:hypothetical protein C8F04DRAFT_1179471 [Mycena alexandri]